MDPTDFIAMQRNMPMQTSGPGIFWNNPETQKQVCVTWEQLATVLKANGYCSMVNEEIGKITNRIARIGSPNWQEWAQSADLYRKMFSVEVYSVPDQIMQLLPTSGEADHIGYIKSEIVHPKNGKCTALWLQHVAKTSLPNWSTPKVPPLQTHAQEFKPGEVAALLAEEGWCYIKGRVINKHTLDVMRNVPQGVMNRLPKAILHNNKFKVEP